MTFDKQCLENLSIQGAAWGRTLSVVKALENYNNPSNQRHTEGGRRTGERLFSGGEYARENRGPKSRRWKPQTLRKERDCGRQHGSLWLILTGAVTFCKVMHPPLLCHHPTLTQQSIFYIFSVTVRSLTLFSNPLSSIHPPNSRPYPLTFFPASCNSAVKADTESTYGFLSLYLSYNTLFSHENPQFACNVLPLSPFLNPRLEHRGNTR